MGMPVEFNTMIVTKEKKHGLRKMCLHLKKKVIGFTLFMCRLKSERLSGATLPAPRRRSALNGQTDGLI